MPRQGHGGCSAFVSFGDRPQGQTSVYRRCVFDHARDTWDHEDAAYVFVTHGPGIGAVLLEDVVSRGAGWSVDNTESGADIQIRGGLLEDNRLELYGKGIRVSGLRVTGPQGTVDVSASGCVLEGLIITGTDLGTAWYRTAVLSRGPGNTGRGCRILLAPDAPGFDTCLAVADAGTGFRYDDNVLAANGPAFKNWAGSVAEARDNQYPRPPKP